MNDLFIGCFSMASNAVVRSCFAAAGCEQKSINVVFYIEPVSDVEPIPVQGDGLTFSSFEGHQRDQFFRKIFCQIFCKDDKI